MTQAAVSRRVKQLEDHLGYALFIRNGRHLSFSRNGEQLFLRLQDLLELMNDTLESLSAGHKQMQVSIAAGNSVSHLWLSSRLRQFTSIYPEVPVRVLSTDNQAEITSPDNDLAIIYSSGNCPGWTLTHLLIEELIPVAAPDYLAFAGITKPPAEIRPEELLELRLHDYLLADGRWLNLQSWFNRIVGGGKTVKPATQSSTYMLALNAAREGDGVALGSRPLVEDHLKKGELVEVTSNVLATGCGYYLGYQKDRKLSEDQKRLFNFLSRG